MAHALAVVWSLLADAAESERRVYFGLGSGSSRRTVLSVTDLLMIK